MPGLLPELNWEDGLLLRPQHLQAFQRHCQGLIAQLALARPFGFGVRRLVIRREMVANWIFEIEGCEIIMPDGSLVTADGTAHIAPIEFRHLGEDAPRLDVWLAVPLLDPLAPNVSTGDADARRRYISEEIDVADENTGTRAQTIGVRKLNGRLFIGQVPPDGHATLKIAELEKVVGEGEEGTRYELSENYVPACLSIDASGFLFTVIKDIRDRVEQKNRELLEHLRGRRDLLTGESMERPETLIKLQATNAILPVVRQLAMQPEMHPFDTYLNLCRLVGDLGIFGESWDAPLLAAYDHTNPREAYLDLKNVTLRLLDAAVESQIDRVEFTMNDPALGMWEVTLPDTFFAEGVTLYLGAQTDKVDTEVAELFTNGRTVLAAPDEILMVRRARIDAVPCRQDKYLHPSLKDRDGLVFLQIHAEGDFWPAARDARKFALMGEAADQGMSFWVYAAGVTREL